MASTTANGRIRMTSSGVPMELLPENVVIPQRMPRDRRLFRHRGNPDWGVGLWVKEERTRRRLRFEDGELRAFKKGFYHLLKPIDPDNVDVDEVFEDLASEHELAIQERQDREARDARPPALTLGQQLAVFKDLAPTGFQDPEWKEAFREPVDDDGTPRKRHLYASSKLAQKAFNKAAFTDRTVAELMGDVVDILSGTSLVKPKSVKTLKALDDEQKQLFVVGLRDVLYGEDRFRNRFQKWVDTLKAVGCKPTWEMATALLALTEPEKHVCVKPSVIDQQARLVRPRTRVGKRVTPRGYKRARKVIRAIRKQLIEAEEIPADLLDVRSFVWHTLRPAGQRRAEELGAV